MDLLSRISAHLNEASPASFDDESLARLTKLQYVGLLGTVGHPLYYYIWAHVFPQPYENIALRALCTLLFIPLLFSMRLKGKAWLLPYSFVAITIGLPFLFAYMYLMNGANLVWSESLLGSVIIVYHFGVIFATCSLLVGGTLAVLFYGLNEAPFALGAQAHLWEQGPILAFFVVVILIIKLDRRVLLEAKQRGMAAALASVAHELRTPLASIDSTLVGFERHLPAMLENPDTARAKAEQLYMALRRMRIEVRNVHVSIDLLLANSKDQVSIPRTNFDLSLAVGKAIAEYPFYFEHEREQIALALAPGLQVTGNEQMFRMVLNNLLKNALRSVARAGRGVITITVRGDTRGYALLEFCDTAEGIDPDVLPHIFDRFYTYPPGSGNGIGLSFCRSVLAQWHARISCESELGKQTCFTIAFPPPKRVMIAREIAEGSGVQ